MAIYFWFGLTWACIIWYSIVTGYVAVKGFADIKTMLHHLNPDAENKDT